MIRQILPNNNEKCYSNFSPKFSQLNTAPSGTKDVVAVGALQFRIHAERARRGDTHRRDLGGEMWIGTGMLVLAHWTG
jgi:hypothetical protein